MAVRQVLLPFAGIIAVALAGSVPFYKDFMKDFNKKELTIVDEFVTIDQRPIDPNDYKRKFECDDVSCWMCSTLKVGGDKHEVCVREYTRKSKPSGLRGLYLDGQLVKEFSVFNRYCQKMWGRISGCLWTYGRDPEKGQNCYKIEVGLMKTFLTFDLNCVQQDGNTLKQSVLEEEERPGMFGILHVNVFAGPEPKFVINKLDKENAEMIKTAVNELMQKF